MFTKICGITRLEDAECAIQHGAAAIGFIAYPKSPRYIPPAKVKTICSKLPDAIIKAGVFVNADMAEIKAYVAAGLTVIQLHGDETATFATNLKQETGLEIWRAIRPLTQEDITPFRNFPADKFLIDAFCAKERGGTGKLANWDLAAFATETLPAPLLLAGGLKADNVAEAITTVKPFGLDLSSGVEDSPGIKNHDAIANVFQQIKQLH